MPANLAACCFRYRASCRSPRSRCRRAALPLRSRHPNGTPRERLNLARRPSRVSTIVMFSSQQGSLESVMRVRTHSFGSFIILQCCEGVTASFPHSTCARAHTHTHTYVLIRKLAFTGSHTWLLEGEQIIILLILSETAFTEAFTMPADQSSSGYQCAHGHAQTAPDRVSGVGLGKFRTLSGN
jgi:hypothetical protein